MFCAPFTIRIFASVTYFRNNSFPNERMFIYIICTVRRFFGFCVILSAAKNLLFVRLRMTFICVNIYIFNDSDCFMSQNPDITHITFCNLIIGITNSCQSNTDKRLTFFWYRLFIIINKFQFFIKY